MNKILTSTFKRIIVISYRLPFRIQTIEGKPQLVQNSGGLVSAMLALSERVRKENGSIANQKLIWIGKADNSPDEYKNARAETDAFELVPVEIDDKTNSEFYSGFCNNLIWPLFHYFPASAKFSESYFESYIQTQQLFLNKLETIIEPDDLVWIHDYQLLLLPGMLRALIPDANIGFFLHIPFPSFEIFRLLHRPWREAILQGMLGADLVGFHINDYAQYFHRAVTRTLGYDAGVNTITVDGRIVKVDAFPIGIDFDKFNDAVKTKKVQNEIKSIKSTLGDKKLIFSIDRLDYTKGFINRIDGFEYFLETYPQWHDKVIFNMVVIPSRDSIPHYQEMKKEIDAAVGRVNAKFGTIAWRPIVYQYKSLSFEELVALYHYSEVALITPLRDGMNLVCKEYVACQNKSSGVLILSEMAGAAAELSEAMLINPTDVKEVGQAIFKALQISQRERDIRINMMRTRLKNYDIFSWAKDYLNSIEQIKKEQSVLKIKVLDRNLEEVIIQKYTYAGKRIIFLDYDGTLVPFTRFPELAIPGSNTISLLNNLSSDPSNMVVIISGRVRSFLNEWFGKLNVCLIAEHGAYVKLPGKDWTSEVNNEDSWKPTIMTILQKYTNRCTGSFVEEKINSIVWHYRNADSDISQIKAKELREELRDIVSNDTRIHLIEGQKVIEVKRAGYDKGYAAMKIIKSDIYEFILAIGDDKTDEDLFRVLPDHTFTLKVGMVPSLAKYNLHGQQDVSRLIKMMIDSSTKKDERFKYPNEFVFS
jgi:trehalose 6-phosphate synthase/phosphatase